MIFYDIVIVILLFIKVFWHFQPIKEPLDTKTIFWHLFLGFQPFQPIEAKNDGCFLFNKKFQKFSARIIGMERSVSLRSDWNIQFHQLIHTYILTSFYWSVYLSNFSASRRNCTCFLTEFFSKLCSQSRGQQKLMENLCLCVASPILMKSNRYHKA